MDQNESHTYLIILALQEISVYLLLLLLLFMGFQ